MVAEGSRKEAWYALTSTKDRLEAIEHVLEKDQQSRVCEKCVNRELNPDLYLGRVES